MTKTTLTHAEVHERARAVAQQIRAKFSVQLEHGLFAYAVPRGGIPAAYVIQQHIPEMVLVTDVNKADVIIDDLVDSGATRSKLRAKLGKNMPFYALFDKKKSKVDRDMGWLVFPWEKDEQEDHSAEDIVVRMLQRIGEDPTREGLAETPARVIKAWDEIFSGYRKDPQEVFKTFDGEGVDQIVLLKDIEMYSMCEHHILPFFGKAHIAYIPNKRVIGVSKLARLMDIFSRRLQIQERIGQQITDALMNELKPKGAACIIDAVHLCTRMRGVNKQHSSMVTSSLKGVFLTKAAARNELLAMIK